MRIRRSIITALLLGFGLVPLWNVATAQQIIFVDQSANGLDNGSSWPDAFVFLQDALGAASSGNEIWVSDGLYHPDGGDGISVANRDTSFVIPSGVSIYGGFSGIENTQGQRDWIQNETILSGDLLGNDDLILSFDNPLRQDNSRQIVRVIDPSSTVQIDGFTITGGHLEMGVFLKCCGSAVNFRNGHSFPGQLIVRNSRFVANVSNAGTVSVRAGLALQPDYSLIFSDNVMENNLADVAGGIHVSSSRTEISKSRFESNRANQSSSLNADQGYVDISRSIFVDNVANSHGTIYSRGESSGQISVWSSRFIGNQALISGPGAIEIDGSHLVSINTVFSGNRTVHQGGALNLALNSAVIINNVFAFNEAGERGGAIVSAGINSTLITNSIFYQNSAPNDANVYSWGPDHLEIHASILEGGIADGVIDIGMFDDVDPLFVDPDGVDDVPGTIDDDFRLSFLSPAIDAGENSRLPQDILDLDRDGDFFEPLPADIFDNVRVFDGGIGLPIVDIGAIEFNAPPIFTDIQVEGSELLPQPIQINLFPNPVHSQLRINWISSRSRFIDLRLFDSLGRQISVIARGLDLGSSVFLVDVSGLASGLYIVFESETRSSGSFVVTR